MFNGLKFKPLFAVIGLCALSAAWSEHASAQVIDCTTAGPDALQTAIDSGTYLIEFTGTCNESVGIYRDNVHLKGNNADPALNVINGGVDIAVAQDIVLENLKIQGEGFYVTGGGEAEVLDSIIADTDFGVFIGRNAVVRFDGNTFGPALVDDGDQSCVPICIADNSHVRMRGNTVNAAASDPGSGAAVAVFRDSSLSMRGGNVINNSGSIAALGIYWDSSVRQDVGNVAVTGHISGGIEILGDSLFDTREAVITGDSTVGLNSTMRVASTDFGGDPSLMEINGKIELSQDSALLVGSPLVKINGDVTCVDGESSAEGSFAGTGTNLCSGFSSVENDFNGDGKADVLWRNTANGAVAIWLMDGGRRLAASIIGTPPLVWEVDTVEDYDGDGKSDLLWRNTANGVTVLWLMDGLAIKSTPRIGAPDTVWQVQ